MECAANLIYIGLLPEVGGVFCAEFLIIFTASVIQGYYSVLHIIEGSKVVSSWGLSVKMEWSLF